MQSWQVATAADCRIGVHQDQGGLRPRRPPDLLRYRRRIASHTGSRDPSTRESASTNGLPGTDHARPRGFLPALLGGNGHNLTELRSDLARVTFLLDHDDDEGLFGGDPLS